jgi:hypothetical protein
LELIVYVFGTGEEMAADTFPAGLRVLAVDDDRVCLKVLERQLKYCNYNGVCSCLLSRPYFPRLRCDTILGQMMNLFCSG